MSEVILYNGDVRTILPAMPERSVQCVVTSPPYWGLRDYQTGEWEGGRADCDHTRGNPRTDHRHGTWLETRGEQAGSAARSSPQRAVCRRCGAIRRDAQLGMEASPTEYVADLVAIFGEVHRVLRDDGVLWLNLGDSYASAHACDRRNVYKQGSPKGLKRPNRLVGGLKEKDLVGIPWRVAFAMREAGWYLRSDVIWAKPNPMPESVGDRPTKAHEYLFLFAKSERYYYDPTPLNEASVSDHPSGNGYKRDARLSYKDESGPRGSEQQWQMTATRNARSVWRVDYNLKDAEAVLRLMNAGVGEGDLWTINTRPFPGAHFATFPEELAQRCILSGSRPGDFVMDPFGGSGTVSAVSVGHGRRSIYVDLNPDYLTMAEQRIGPMFCRRWEVTV